MKEQQQTLVKVPFSKEQLHKQSVEFSFPHRGIEGKGMLDVLGPKDDVHRVPLSSCIYPQINTLLGSVVVRLGTGAMRSHPKHISSVG